MNKKDEKIRDGREIEQTSLGAAIRYLRKRKELSLQELSDRVGCNSSYLSLIETGKRKNPTANFLMALSDALEADLMALYLEPSLKTDASDRELETVIFGENVTINGKVLQAREKVALIEILKRIEMAEWCGDIFGDSAKILNAVSEYKKIIVHMEKLA